MSELTKEIAQALFALTVPGYGVLSGAVGAAAARVASMRERASTKRLARQISALVRLRAEHELNRGSARAAAEDVRSTIGKAKITIATLLEHNLDAAELAGWLTREHPPEHLDKAGPERSRNYREAIHLYAHRLVAASADLPGMRTAFLSEVLRRQAEILDKLPVQRRPQA